ncbi:unnamed protein product [Paramecium primaurelia]|uniref:RING-type domain-containing protein n=1 Tax=Paramecium primaurelia TaxID=5886 RepID=A0A8S1NBA4_PARPR|nr:unnamed protein product [Paramecium primaurelia]
MSRGNQRVQLPQIQQKQQVENYNFITSKKKTVQFQQSLPQEDIQEDWKKKCEELQKDVETRNQTIFSIQRNFESLSALLKTEKQENMGIRDEVVRLRELNQQLQQQDKDNQQKINENQRKLKELQQYHDQLQEERKTNQRQNVEINNLKNQITQLEAIINRKENEIRQMSQTITSLQMDLSLLPSLTKDNEKLQQNIETLKEQIIYLEKSNADKELNLQIAFKNHTQLNSLIENLKLDNIAAQGTIKHLKSEENISLLKIAKQQQDIQELQSQIKQLQDQLNNQNTVLQTRNQQDGQQNQAILQLQKQLLDSQKQYQIIIDENQNLTNFVNENMPIIEQYQLVLSTFGNTNFIQLIKDYQKLQQDIKLKIEKHEQTLQETQKLTEKLQQCQLEVTSVRSQITQLQQQNKELTQKASYFEDELKTYQTIKSSSLNNEQVIKTLQTQLKHKSENEQNLLSQMRIIQQELQQYSEFDGLIMTYKQFTKPAEFILTSDLNQLKQNIEQITQSNQLYIEDIEQRNKQIESLTQQIQDKDQILNDQNTQLSNSNQQLLTLKMKLDQTLIELDQLSKESKAQKASIDQLGNDLTMANKENRNLSQQVYEQMENLQQLNMKNGNLQKELNQNQDITYKLGLDVKNLTQKLKKAEEELEMLNPEKMRGLQLQLDQKEKEFQSQLQNIALALDAQITSISCNSCMEVLQKTNTCYPCGHSYCEKCFQNQCSECQDQDGWFKNKRLDDLISKINYSKQILNTYKKK